MYYDFSVKCIAVWYCNMNDYTVHSDSTIQFCNHPTTQRAPLIPPMSPCQAVAVPRARDRLDLLTFLTSSNLHAVGKGAPTAHSIPLSPPSLLARLWQFPVHVTGWTCSTLSHLHPPPGRGGGHRRTLGRRRRLRCRRNSRHQMGHQGRNWGHREATCGGRFGSIFDGEALRQGGGCTRTSWAPLVSVTCESL